MNYDFYNSCYLHGELVGHKYNASQKLSNEHQKSCTIKVWDSSDRIYKIT